MMIVIACTSLVQADKQAVDDAVIAEIKFVRARDGDINHAVDVVELNGCHVNVLHCCISFIIVIGEGGGRP